MSASVLHHTNVEKLTFLSSGTMHARAAEVLASDAMTALLAELATRYSDRIIIFDSPPLLVTTEARVLANRMGQIVFVVSAETHASKRRDSCVGDHRDLPGQDDGAQQGAGQRTGSVRLRVRLRLLNLEASKPERRSADSFTIPTSSSCRLWLHLRAFSILRKAGH